MKKHTVEAFEDPSRPGGGHAIILVRGPAEVPDGLTFRLRPADGSTALDRPGTWPDGERRPLALRLTPKGTEIVVGPEIVESPELLPGTLAILDIPKCGVRGEFLWPSIQPVPRPKRRHVLMRPPRGSIAAEAAAERDGKQVAFSEATDASSHVTPEPAPAGADSEAGEAWAAHAATEVAVARDGADNGSAAAPGVMANAAGAAGLGGKRRSGPPPLPLGSRRSARAGTARAAMLVAAFAAGALAMSLSPWRAPATGVRTPPHAAAEARPAPFVDALLGLVAAGTLSPRGLDTARLEAPQLLERADMLINGPPETRDGEEARFLIRRALAATLTSERLLWALTQLGSIDAEPGPGRRPDYERAAAVWQLAAVLGDPIAMCFLAALSEHGLGTPRNARTALDWYLRAKASGGCPGSEDAIQRLRN
jgi:hypothetical protein